MSVTTPVESGTTTSMTSQVCPPLVGRSGKERCEDDIILYRTMSDLGVYNGLSHQLLRFPSFFFLGVGFIDEGIHIVIFFLLSTLLYKVDFHLVL